MTSRFIPLLVLIWLLTPLMSQAKETKDIQFKFRYADPVVFSHDFHLLKYNNNCRICHNAIFNIRQLRHFTMAEMEKTKSCGACHSGVKAFSVANEKDCVRCHKGVPRNIPFKPKGATEVVFSHTFHLSKSGIHCKSCHNDKVLSGKEKPVTMAEMDRGKSCGACHNGKRAFSVNDNCNTCHKGFQPHNIVFEVKGLSHAVFSHDLHLGMDYKCSTCHTKIFPYRAGAKHFTMSDMEHDKSCGTCHNGKVAFTVSGGCDKCHTK